MKLGLLTACFPEKNLDWVSDWAAANEFKALEVACWPVDDTQDFHAHHIDTASLTPDKADAIAASLATKGIEISALAFYENNLHRDPQRRSAIHEHLRACIRAAEMLNVHRVGTFIGRNMAVSVRENLDEGEQVLPDLVAYAHDHGVELVIENCPMEGWGPDGYPANLAYSPELWDWMLAMGFKLNFDPSHLMWLGIDPVKAARDYGSAIEHVQAKDVELMPEARQSYSIFGKTVSRKDGWDVGWWRYRLPGLGQVDWGAFIDVLYQHGYDGAISIEHEDPVWSGSTERTADGLLIAKRELTAHLVPSK